MKSHLILPLAGAAAALALSACQTTKSAETPPMENPDACGASKASAFVGQELTAATRMAIQDRTGASNIRWIAPNTAVTMDYRADRLNVNYNEQNIISSITCG